MLEWVNTFEAVGIGQIYFACEDMNLGVGRVESVWG